MFNKEEIKNNINSEWNIPLETQKEFRYCLCKFILNTSQKIGLSYDRSSLAMLITNFFFIKNLYFNYNKLTICCASLLLSSKNETSQNKFNDICKEYSLIRNKSLDAEIHKIREHISKYEILLLKQLKYYVPQEFPYDLINYYSELLYPNNFQEIKNISIKIANDSYFTYANNIYRNYVVALSCLVIAAKFLEIPTILDDDFRNIDNMKKIHKKNISEEEFLKALNQYDNQSIIFYNKNEEEGQEMEKEDIYFDNLTKCQKLYPCLKIDDLLDCILMIMEYYEDMSDKSNFNFTLKK